MTSVLLTAADCWTWKLVYFMHFVKWDLKEVAARFLFATVDGQSSSDITVKCMCISASLWESHDTCFNPRRTPATSVCILARCRRNPRTPCHLRTDLWVGTSRSVIGLLYCTYMYAVTLVVINFTHLCIVQYFRDQQWSLNVLCSTRNDN